MLYFTRYQPGWTVLRQKAVTHEKSGVSGHCKSGHNSLMTSLVSDHFLLMLLDMNSSGLLASTLRQIDKQIGAKSSVLFSQHYAIHSELPQSPKDALVHIKSWVESREVFQQNQQS